jgi:hypothetical protein
MNHFVGRQLAPHEYEIILAGLTLNHSVSRQLEAMARLPGMIWATGFVSGAYCRMRASFARMTFTSLLFCRIV